MEYLKKEIYDENELAKFIKKASIYILIDPVTKSKARAKEHNDLFLFDDSNNKSIVVLLLSNNTTMMDKDSHQQFSEQNIAEIELEPLVQNLSTALSNDRNKPPCKDYKQQLYSTRCKNRI